MSMIKCKMCGGDMEITSDITVAECEYCGSKQTVPTVDDEKKIKLFERANKLRFACEFDKAAGVYEAIVADFSNEAEAYWGLILCKYGIEYVDDPATGKKIPTCHRSSFESVMDDHNFELVMENADVVARKVYRDEAKAIEELRKGIIEVSANEEPYDIFICYKETAEDGQRTLDSVLAQDVYDALTEKGYRVFFSRITLEDRLGTEYEPYIFAALNSAKIMLAFGTDYEYFNAVWVKNEWSRFLQLMTKDKSKHLIPCYKDIDAYDMPKEFAKLQAQDMGKVGAVQDLMRGIEKLLPKNKEEAPVTVAQPVVQQVIQQSGTGVDSLLERAFMFLEDADFKSADEYCEKVLDSDPKNDQAYLGKLMAELGCRKRTDLKNVKKPFDSMANYQKAVRFGDDKLKSELQSYIDNINEKIEKARIEAEIQKKEIVYTLATSWFKIGKSDIKMMYQAKYKFESIKDYKDSSEKIKKCEEVIYKYEAEQKEKSEKTKQTLLKVAKIIAPILAVLIVILVIITKVIIPSSHYKDGEKYLAEGDYMNAKISFFEADSFKDSEDKFREIFAAENAVSCGSCHTVGVKSDGTVVAVGIKDDGQCNVSGWSDIRVSKTK